MERSSASLKSELALKEEVMQVLKKENSTLIELLDRKKEESLQSEQQSETIAEK